MSKSFGRNKQTVNFYNFLLKLNRAILCDIFFINRLPELKEWWNGNASLHSCYVSRHKNPICDDKLWIAPRDAALRLLNTYNTLLKCNISCPEKSICWKKRGSCCNRNEYALAYSGSPLSPRPSSKYIKMLESSFVVVRTEKDILNNVLKLSNGSNTKLKGQNKRSTRLTYKNHGHDGDRERVRKYL